MQVMSYILNYRKSYFDSLKTFEVIDAESPIVIFFGTYGSYKYTHLCTCARTQTHKHLVTF